MIGSSRYGSRSIRYMAGLTLIIAILAVVPAVIASTACTIEVTRAPGEPLSGVQTYLFNESGTYLNLTAATDTSGQVVFDLADGSYQVRADYLGARFWSEVFQVPQTVAVELPIVHATSTVTVSADFAGSLSPLAGVRVYLFTESGAYQNRCVDTDASGQAVFDLPDAPYKVRADWSGGRFWSPVFRLADTTVTVPMADAVVSVTGSGQGLEGVPVYAFTEVGTYLNLSAATDASGQAVFRVPAGTYKFRSDYQSNRYWSEATDLAAGVATAVAISTGGASVAVTVTDGRGAAPAAVPCYVFNESGTYLNLTAATDTSGQVVFDLADGSYQVRADYLGARFWSEVFQVPQTVAVELPIVHATSTVTVSADFAGSLSPLAGVRVYLFTESGGYQSRCVDTDASGQAVFDLPDAPYKVRADWLGARSGHRCSGW